MQFAEVISIKGQLDVATNGKYFAAQISPTKVTIKKILASGTLSTENNIECSMEVTNISLSPDSEYLLAWSTKQNTAAVFDLKGNTVCNIEQGLGIFNCMWASDSRQILLFTTFKMTVYNLSDGTTNWFKSAKCLPKGCVFSNCGKFMALAERKDCKDSVGIYFVNGWKLLNHFYLNQIQDLAGLSWAPNNSFLIAWDCHFHYKLIPICLLNGVLSKYSAYEDAMGIKDVIYSHNSLLVAVGSYDQKIRILNAMTWKLVGQLNCPTNISANNVICYKQKQRQTQQILAKTTATLIELTPLANIKIPVNKVISGNQDELKQGIRLMQISPSDLFIAGKNDNMPNVLWIWQLKSLSLVSVIVLSSPVCSFQWAPDKDILCFVNKTTHVFLWSSMCLHMFQLPFANNPIQPQKVKWTSNGHNLVLSDKSNATVIEVYEGLADRLLSNQ